VLAAEVALPEVADRYARALDAQIRILRLQRAVLRAVATSTNAEELERMSDLTSMTADERHRILDDYLEAVFGDQENPVAERLRTGAPELPDDPTADQVAAWVELVELLRDPGYIESSRRMVERAQAERAAPDGGHEAMAAIQEQASAAVQAGITPDSPEALAVIERIEALTPGGGGDRLELAERLETFVDRRVSLLDAGGHRQRLAQPSRERRLGGRLGVVCQGATSARIAARHGRAEPVMSSEDCLRPGGCCLVVAVVIGGWDGWASASSAMRVVARWNGPGSQESGSWPVRRTPDLPPWPSRLSMVRSALGVSGRIQLPA